MASAQTARTSYVEAANGVKYAYRQIGQQTSTPLVMHIHFRANMDFWDPILINSLAKYRSVIIFDQAGVGRSTGNVPRTYQGWADDLIAFVTALGLSKIDLLGFSMGGKAVQMVALTSPRLVRRLILAGTSASEPSSKPQGVVWPRDIAPNEPIKALSTATNLADAEAAIAMSFFYNDNGGRAAAKAYWDRIQERNVEGEPLMLGLLDLEKSREQRAAAADWMRSNPRNSFDRLQELNMPVLVLNGDNDLLIPTSRSWELSTEIQDAQLVIYPRAGHGFIWQYAELVASQIIMFLDRAEYEGVLSKL